MTTELTHPEPDRNPQRAQAILTALDIKAEEHREKDTPETTKRSHAKAWTTWQTYTAAFGIPETSNTNGALVGYVVHLERLDLSPNTILSRLSGVIVGLRRAGAAPDDDTKLNARAAVEAYKKRLAKAGETRGRGQAPALTIKYLRAIVQACPDTPAGIRDRALVLMAFSIAARRSEVANLAVGDIRRTEDGLIVHVRFSKTGPRRPQIPAIPGSATCPVAAWDQWIEMAGHEEGPAFRAVHRSGRILLGLTPGAVGAIITRVAKRAEIPAHLTGHSARAGMATEARRAGHDKLTIADQGGWSRSSAALEGYFREVDRWANNPLKGIGL